MDCSRCRASAPRRKQRDRTRPALAKRHWRQRIKRSTIETKRSWAFYMDRRLTAILAADVVGFSRLMGADESGTLAALKSARAEIIDPGISQHHGRIFKLTGDGILAEFPSVVSGLACAVEIQKGMR